MERNLMKPAMNVCCTNGAAALVLALAIQSSMGADTLISTGAVWKYLDTGIDGGTAWRTVAYEDSVWPRGVGKFGFGEGDESTVLLVLWLIMLWMYRRKLFLRV
jgi:hypothetical protein